MAIPTLSGITAKTISTGRLTTRVLFAGPDDGRPVLFLHGNTSSATWWEEVMTTLPRGYRGIAPDQRGYGEADPDKHIDATRGMGDLADDAAVLLDTLGIRAAHVVGNSMGGSVVWRLLMDHAERVLSTTQVDPGSPYGFGGTRDLLGTPTTPDFSGSGGGLANPELIRRISENDQSLDSPFSPRMALRTAILKPPFVSSREDALVLSMNATHIGPQDMPGDKTTSPNWPLSRPACGARPTRCRPSTWATSTRSCGSCASPPSCGSAATATCWSPTRPPPTSASWAAEACCQAGPAPTPIRPSRWSRKPAHS